MSHVRHVRIPRGPISLAADLHLPDELDAATPAAAVVISTPGSSVKEQIGANYARRLAAAGIVTVAFDPAYQGESEGEPRDLEDPYEREADLRYVIDYLDQLPDVDNTRIGMLGICAGGGYAVHTTSTDHRIRALGAVVPVNIGRAFRQGATDPGALVAGLEQAARQREAEARGEDQARENWLPDTEADAQVAGITDVDVLEAIRYYRTSRGGNSHSTNRRLSRGDAQILGYDGFHLASELLTQPVQVIVGGRIGSTGSYFDGLRLWEMVTNQDSFVVVDGAGHYEMYDEPRYVDQAVEHLADFFTRQLAAASR